MRKFLFHPALLALALYGCEIGSMYEHVERVIRNDAGAVTIYLRDGSGSLQSVYLSTSHNLRAEIVADVPEGMSMWAEQRREGGCKSGVLGGGTRVIVHVRSPADIEEAGHGR
ncbi:MAG TPA: hypothetical protein VJ694_02565 [Patescibacteria group bacterium]|nr:hypothetical protein [Patescibacteria group bacterium]